MNVKEQIYQIVEELDGNLREFSEFGNECMLDVYSVIDYFGWETNLFVDDLIRGT